MLVFSIKIYKKDMTDIYNIECLEGMVDIRKKDDGKKVIKQCGNLILEETGEDMYLSWCKRVKEVTDG